MLSGSAAELLLTKAKLMKFDSRCRSLPNFITQEIGGRMATRLAMVAVVLTALMALVGASENHEWFVADLGVSSDLGEDVQADKAPLSAGMIVTLRGGSANHHCGDASGSTACRHKSPTEVGCHPPI